MHFNFESHAYIHCLQVANTTPEVKIMRSSPYKDLSFQKTHPTKEMLATLPGSTSPTLFEQWCQGSFTSAQEQDKLKFCETGPTVLRPYPRKTRNSCCLQMSLQRQHFLLSYLKTLSVGPAEV